MLKKTYIETINFFLKKFIKNPNNYFLGQDIMDPYGGAFKATKGLTQLSNNNLIAMPISEGLIAGTGIGLFLNGKKVVIEIMFGDFSTLIVDQLINGISNFYDYADKKKMGSIVFRLPMGAYRGYGSTHSKSIENLFLNIPNIKVFTSSIIGNPGRAIERCVFEEKISIFLEHKISYPNQIEIENFKNLKLIKNKNNSFAIVKFSNNASRFVIFTYGFMTQIALEALYKLIIKYEIFGEIIDVYDLSMSFSKEKKDFLNRKYERIFTLEEGHTKSGWGKSIVDFLFEFKDHNSSDIVFLGPKFKNIPNSKTQELEMLPNADHIVEKIKSFF